MPTKKSKHLLLNGKYPKRFIYIASTLKWLKYAINIVSIPKGENFAIYSKPTIVNICNLQFVLTLKAPKITRNP